MTSSSSSIRNLTLKDSTLTAIREYFKGPESEAQTKTDKLIPILTEIVNRVLKNLTEEGKASIQEGELKGSIEFAKGCKIIVKDIEARGINIKSELEWEAKKAEVKSEIQSQVYQVFKIQKIA